MSSGNIYSPAENNWSALCISKNNRAQISQKSCPKDTNHAIAGREIFIENGKPAVLKNSFDKNDLFPRTAVAVDDRGEKMWLIIVDGRQYRYSEGVTLSELTDIVMELGVDKALNLDGGGSTTLVSAGFWGPYSLNSPFHTGIPLHQRPIANHLGFYAPAKN
jgi:exopolysaccharide biosynthesis protein